MKNEQKLITLLEKIEQNQCYILDILEQIYRNTIKEEKV
jgi:hypothetical protein